MIRRLLLLIVLWPAALFGAELDGIEPGDVSLTLEIEAPTPTPYEQEMILLHIRGTYLPVITLESLEQPTMQGFAWTQLGYDKWDQTDVQGRPARSFERTMAIFAVHPGAITIDPFIHHLTLIGSDGQRHRHDVVSAPLTIHVQPHPIVASTPSQWWLPARKVTLTDTMDRDPKTLHLGETARRTVTLTAEGVGVELLPPMPNLLAPGLLAFADPEERETHNTPQGPVSTAHWSWTIRPLPAAEGTLGGVSIAWFDTIERKFKTVSMSSKAFGVTKADAEVRPTLEKYILLYQEILKQSAWLLGFLATLYALMRGKKFKTKEEIMKFISSLWPDPDVSQMRKAARRKDVLEMRDAAMRWQKRTGQTIPKPVLDQLNRAAYSANNRPEVEFEPLIKR